MGKAPDEAEMKRPTGGKLVVDALKLAGVRRVYLVPGGQTLAILDAAYGDPDIDFIVMRHEMSAAHAADGQFRTSGVPGVCLVTTGPGLTHAASAIGGALRDRSGLVIISCNNRREHLEEEDAQAADHIPILRPLTKWSVQVSHAHALTRSLRAAFSLAVSAPGGPVHVDLPRDILESPVPEGTEWPEGAGVPRPHEAVAPSSRALDKAAALLAEAERPVFWVGNGVAYADASVDLLNLAEHVQAPIVTTFSGIGSVPSGHHLVFGPRTRHGTRLSHSVLDQADAVFAVGMRLSSSSTHRWTARLPVLVHNDADFSAIGRHYAPDVALPGDAKLVIGALSERLSQLAPPATRLAWLEALAKERQDWLQQLAESPAEDSQGRIHPIELMKQLAAVAPENAIFSVDAGNPGIWSHLLPVAHPRSYMKPVNFGQMGFALPAAIAAKLGHPERSVVAIVGDGSLGMSVAELETAVRKRLGLTVVVLNDSAYNNIKQEQLFLTGKPRYIAVDFGQVNYAQVAEGFGAWGRRAVGAAQVRSAMYEAFQQQDRPALVDVVLAPEPSVWDHLF
jgi:acetolactate synthase-1/2/3 large subunit